MGKCGHGASGDTHSQNQLDHYANQNNRVNQCNPKNDESSIVGKMTRTNKVRFWRLEYV